MERFIRILSYAKRKMFEKHIEVISIDFIYQIVFFDDQFQDNLRILNYIDNSSNEKKLSLSSFETLYNEIYELFLTGHQKIFPELTEQDFIDNIKLLLDKVCFSHLPEFILGFTCMNSAVFIRYPQNKDLKFKYLSSKAYTFLTILHEFGHFFQRKDFELKSQWFNFETPTQANLSPKGGSRLIIKIFGKELYEISYYGSEYVLNKANWRDKSLEKFREEFLMQNSRSPPSIETHYKSARLKQGALNSTSLISLYNRRLRN
ncbi:hypothetical protein SteCoe_30180 [Stentor coeruleus]|uniref:Uncharacterized protein n=1 Tax=Stentor coeruleus TaxID=5963 RepID=A0A1R2B4B6_9CILI|nr:hypothetical protein SteCoe_30180 [Stentor coeruleus]